MTCFPASSNMRAEMCYSVQLCCRKDAQLLTGRGSVLKRKQR